MLKNKDKNLFIFNKKIKNTYYSENKDVNLYKNKVGKLYHNPSYSKE
jgi:hypothetical protein